MIGRATNVDLESVTSFEGATTSVMAMLDPDLAQRIDMNMVLVDGEEEDRLYSGVAVSDSEEDDMHLQSAESSEVQMDRNMSNVRYGASFMRGEPPTLLLMHLKTLKKWPTRQDECEENLRMINQMTSDCQPLKPEASRRSIEISGSAMVSYLPLKPQELPLLRKTMESRCSSIRGCGCLTPGRHLAVALTVREQ